MSKTTEDPFKWYKSFLTKYDNSKVLFTPLLPQFEHALIHPNWKFTPWLSIKALFGALLLDTYVKPVGMHSNTKVVFWPFQLHHPTFQALAHERLVAEGIRCQTVIFRKDLLPILEKHGMDAVVVKSFRKPKPFKQIISNSGFIIRFLWSILKEPVHWPYKKALLQSCVHLSTIKKAEAAARAVMNETGPAYHIIGYDLSILGRAIISVLKQHRQKTGRIQIGAVNYRLAGFSEVDDLFLWDEESRNAYTSRGYSGNAAVTGNILLQEKYPAGNAFPEMNPILLPGYQRRILVAFSGPGHNTSVEGHIKSLKLLLNLIRDCPDTLFVIKLHPKDKAFYYEELQKEKNVKMAPELFPDKLPNAINFIHATQFVITGASSVALDAINLSKPVISIDPLNELDHFEFLNHPKVTRLKSDKEINEIANWINNYEESLESPKLLNSGLKMITEHIQQYLERVKERSH